MEAFCQIQAPGLFDEVYGSMLKQRNKTYYKELGMCQYCTVLVFTVVKTWSKSLFWNLYYNLRSIVSIDVQQIEKCLFPYWRPKLQKKKFFVLTTLAKTRTFEHFWLRIGRYILQGKWLRSYVDYS